MFFKYLSFCLFQQSLDMARNNIEQKEIPQEDFSYQDAFNFSSKNDIFDLFSNEFMNDIKSKFRIFSNILKPSFDYTSIQNHLNIGLAQNIKIQKILFESFQPFKED